MRPVDYHRRVLSDRLQRPLRAVIAGVCLTGGVLLVLHTASRTGFTPLVEPLLDLLACERRGVLASLVWPSLSALLVLAASWRVGRRLFRSIPEENLAGGLCLVSLIPMFWGGMPPAEYRHLGMILLLLLFVPAPHDARVSLRGLPARARDEWRALDGSLRALLVVGLAGLSWALFGAVAPPMGMDALTYHLGTPAQYLARGSVLPPDATVYYQYTQASEMMALAGLALDPSGVASGLLFSVGLLLAAVSAARVAGALSLSSGVAAAPARVLAFAAIATMPLSAILVAHTKPDPWSLALVLLALRRLLPGACEPHRAGFFLGAAVAVKLTAAYVALPACLWLAWRERRSPRRVAAVAACALAMPGWWFALNLLFAGHLLPQTPFLAAAAGGGAGPGWLMRLARVLAATFLFLDKQIDGPFGPLVAGLALAGAAGVSVRAQGVRLCAGLSLVAAALWFLSGGGSHSYADTGVVRFLLASLGPLLVAGSVILATLLSPRNRPARLLAAALLVAAVASLAVSVMIVERFHRVLPYFTGRMTREQLLAPWLSSFTVLHEGSLLLPTDALVLSVGEPRLFHLGRDARFEVDGTLPPIYEYIHRARHPDPDRLDLYLRSLGYTHILDARDIYARKVARGISPAPPCPLDRIVFEDYLREKTRPISCDQEHGVFLYELLPER